MSPEGLRRFQLTWWFKKKQNTVWSLNCKCVEWVLIGFFICVQAGVKGKLGRLLGIFEVCLAYITLYIMLLKCCISLAGKPAIVHMIWVCLMSLCQSSVSYTIKLLCTAYHSIWKLCMNCTDTLQCNYIMSCLYPNFCSTIKTGSTGHTSTPS